MCICEVVLKNKKKLKVAVVGLGYVGLPLLAAIASTKLYDCLGVDKDISKLQILKRGRSPLETFASEKIAGLDITFYEDISKVDNLELSTLTVNDEGTVDLDTRPNSKKTLEFSIKNSRSGMFIEFPGEKISPYQYLPD